MTAKADAKKRAKTSAPARNHAPRRKSAGSADADETAANEEGGDETASEGDEPEVLAAESDTFDTEGEVVDDAESDSDEERESSDESEASDDSDKEPANERGLARLDPLQAYMREVQRHPLLSSDEEHKLAVEYVKGQDRDVAARLVTANLRLVVKIAYEYRRAYRNMMDLVQEGNIGLMQAVKRYDPYRGVKLSSYAAWWIRAYMLRFILNNWRLVKVGTTQAQRKLFFNLNKEKARLTAMGIEPSHAEIAKRLNVS
ncbi:MAG TPA: sigma-70 family RNA polymerase sigma factor, partial [Polyangiaceae bacterium]|nr:sigma-70 family RNA polymerase sigma factor [Polyangiaceae bacterium]